MRFLVVDDEKHALNYISTILKETYPQADIFSFCKTNDAVQKAKDIRCDVAFLDIQMDDKNGIELAKELKDINSETNIIFTTAYSEYALDAHRVYASDYLMKPVSCDSILNAMDHLRNPVKPADENKLKIKCFGNFEVFSGDSPIHFKRSKTKELFAYLVDRKGATCSKNELTAVLWEDKADSDSLHSNLRNLISDLQKTLASVNAKSVLVKERNSLAINPDRIICDYYDFIHQIPYAVNSYCGEYMSQFSWAELTLAYIENNR
ncbi:MAG: response regulator [Oscillospiraceae bacterium]|nr:response regulator [Oscillospiraceae bacterium]